MDRGMHYMIIKKATTYIIILMIFNSVPLFSEETVEKNKKESTSSLEGAISIIPYAKWSFPTWSLMQSQENYTRLLDYKMDSTRTTMYEANFRFEPLNLVCGLNLGVNESIIGKVDKVLGIIGYDNIYIRVNQNTIRGSAHWSGAKAPGMQSDFDFKHKFNSYDLFYYFKFEKTEGVKDIIARHIGIGYTEFSIPIQINTTIYSGNKDYHYDGVPTYDDNFSFKIYSIILGADTMAGMMRNEDGASPGFYFWLTGQNRFGYGKYIMSDYSYSTIKTLNPGHNLRGDNKGGALYNELDMTLGIFWVPSFTDGKVAFGVGYNFLYSKMWPMGPKNKEANDMGWQADFQMLRQGIIFRLDAKW